MRAKIIIDDQSMLNALAGAHLDKGDMLDMAGSGSKIIINKQREDIPVDSAASKNSVGSHIEEASAEKVVDEVGPEMDYDPYLEYGTGKYAENGKGRKGGWFYKDSDGRWHFTMGMRARPFVRPSVLGNETNIITAITHTFWKVLQTKWRL